MIGLGIFIVGSAGGFIGSLFDNGNFFGPWGLLLSTIGSFAGIWIGYKVAQNLGL